MPSFTQIPVINIRKTFAVSSLSPKSHLKLINPKVQLDYSSLLAYTLLMFLEQKPLNGIRIILVALSIAPLVAGCTNLESDISLGNTATGAVTTPVVSTVPTDANKPQFIANAADTYDAPDFTWREQDYSALDFETELQVTQAEKAKATQALENQLRAETQAVAAIKASLIETRRNHNAWYRLQKGMQLNAVDNSRVRVQLKWFLDHPGYLQRVMERARPILPFVLDELERRNLPSELALLPIVESAYQAFAYSHGRASGMWQIIPSTGRFLGLKQNWWYAV
jgi:hypothetical protein